MCGTDGQQSNSDIAVVRHPEAVTESSLQPRGPDPILLERRAAELKRAFAGPDSELEVDDRERTLVVVDVQPGFLNTRQEAFLQSTEGLVFAARARGWPIIFLEYVGRFGPTYTRLLKVVEGYEHRSKRVTKDRWSGAREVAKTCASYGFGRQIFRVCGVYTDQCVAATVSELALDFPASLVEVVPAACRSFVQAYKGADNDFWDSFPLEENIRLIPEEPHVYEAADASLAAVAA